jgi:hypothetical protein
MALKAKPRDMVFLPISLVMAHKSMGLVGVENRESDRSLEGSAARCVCSGEEKESIIARRFGALKSFEGFGRVVR